MTDPVALFLILLPLLFFFKVYVEAAQEDVENYVRACAKYQETHPDWQAPAPPRVTVTASRAADQVSSSAKKIRRKKSKRKRRRAPEVWTLLTHAPS
jgi:hypothetical protein